MYPIPFTDRKLHSWNMEYRVSRSRLCTCQASAVLLSYIPGKKLHSQNYVLCNDQVHCNLEYATITPFLIFLTLTYSLPNLYQRHIGRSSGGMCSHPDYLFSHLLNKYLLDIFSMLLLGMYWWIWEHIHSAEGYGWVSEEGLYKERCEGSWHHLLLK